MAPLIRHKQGIDATTSVDWVYGLYFQYDCQNLQFAQGQGTGTDSDWLPAPELRQRFSGTTFILLGRDAATAIVPI